MTYRSEIKLIIFYFQMGFDGLFFGRLDYEDKSQREKSKTMEMMWNGSPNLGI